MDNTKIAIIDYGMGNIYSICNSVRALGAEAVVVSNPNELLSADSAILPGVGAYPDAMQRLRELGMDLAIHEFVGSGKPLLGICLGMQLLCKSSCENGVSEGLGIIPAIVRKFPRVEGYSIPQIQWNKVKSTSGQSTLLDGIPDDSYFYFLHSYYVEFLDSSVSGDLIVSDYCGMTYCSGFNIANVFATQFHPEKSGNLGSILLRNFIKVGDSK
ncbi:imidazole glycerol phosphate synthase subunit HisH [Vibrio cholerae]|uniref:imidazole glycerol phosphate synthase subunit HisH n=1 Tax=Vibrio cholerae TaxID=666 RepID=UPI001EC0EF34|nr:imidazole glycerol phosphate synthase subunit HisH [Vibrio cholerae]EGQ7944302.1 imidazole glycerol phosphate synthase subunit HisH [Vibrio cholerae]MDV2397110.1 imidazole glycerol phosphate synthase subunit HisH [Vibrio cholerae]